MLVLRKGMMLYALRVGWVCGSWARVCVEGDDDVAVGGGARVGKEDAARAKLGLVDVVEKVLELVHPPLVPRRHAAVEEKQREERTTPLRYQAHRELLCTRKVPIHPVHNVRKLCLGDLKTSLVVRAVKSVFPFLP